MGLYIGNDRYFLFAPSFLNVKKFKSVNCTKIIVIIDCASSAEKQVFTGVPLARDFTTKAINHSPKRRLLRFIIAIKNLSKTWFQKSISYKYHTIAVADFISHV